MPRLQLLQVHSQLRKSGLVIYPLRWPKYFVRPQLMESFNCADPLIIALAKLVVQVHLQTRRADILVYISVKILSALLPTNVDASKLQTHNWTPCQYWLSIQISKLNASSFTGNLRGDSFFFHLILFSKLSVFRVSRYLTTSCPHRYRNEAYWIQPHDTLDTYYKLTRQSETPEPRVCAKGSNLRSDVLLALSIFNCGYTILPM